MDQKESTFSAQPKIPFSGFIGVLKLGLFFAPFVLLRGCIAGPYNAFQVAGAVFMPIPMLWPFLLVPLAALVVIILAIFRPWSVVRRSTVGLVVSILSLIGLVWTGWIMVAKSGDYGGTLLWGFWALLICDIGMIGGYARNLKRLPEFQQHPDEYNREPAAYPHTDIQT